MQFISSVSVVAQNPQLRIGQCAKAQTTGVIQRKQEDQNASFTPLVIQEWLFIASTKLDSSETTDINRELYPGGIITSHKKLE